MECKLEIDIFMCINHGCEFMSNKVIGNPYKLQISFPEQIRSCIIICIFKLHVIIHNAIILWSYLLQCQYKPSGKFATISVCSMSKPCFLINMKRIIKAQAYAPEYQVVLTTHLLHV